MTAAAATSHDLFSGVLPAVTTPFLASGAIDHAFLEAHVAWQLAAGCSGIVALGSLGEGATLTLAEKREVLETCVRACGDRAPVIAAVSALSTDVAVEIAQTAQAVGCRGLMVLPPYVHAGPWAEMEAHFSAIFASTKLPGMLYNNPGAYGLDALPHQIADLARKHDNLTAVKESSGDARRISGIRALCGTRLQLCVGLDDVLVEGVGVGARGWVAGLVNALPRASVELFNLAVAASEGREGARDRCDELYRWFLPLLRLDTVPTFVQRIKLVQELTGSGRASVRRPRLEIGGAERDSLESMIRRQLALRPEWLAAEPSFPAH